MQLKEWQQQFVQALTGDEPPYPLCAAIRDDALSTRERLSIYRNNFRIGLTEALAANFPVTVELVDRAFFDQAVWGYIRAYPPTEPSLFAYGKDLPAYLQGLDSLRAYPFIPQVAGLEWLMNEATNAPTDPPSAAIDLTQFNPSRLAESRWRLSHSLRLMETDFPVTIIWEAHKVDRSQLDHLTTEPKSCWLLIYRYDGQIRYASIGQAEFRFVSALAQGALLQDALEEALTIDPAFNLAQSLQFLLARQLIWLV